MRLIHAPHTSLIRLSVTYQAHTQLRMLAPVTARALAGAVARWQRVHDALDTHDAPGGLDGAERTLGKREQREHNMSAHRVRLDPHARMLAAGQGGAQ